ncbi:MAG: hypothetical protein R6X32_00835 [Chloroflexota bacterium]|jgi:hypothetical protein
MKRTVIVTLLLSSFFLLRGWAEQVQAQSDNVALGTIQGVVYEDIDGDGRCVDTGVTGEGPVENVDIEFVSSDRKTIITLYSGPGGIFGLFAAGHSYWEVHARPGPEWVVTSENPRYAPIDGNNLVQTGVNFCVRKADQVQVVLPAAGQANMGWLTAVATLIGFGFIGSGLVLRKRRG